MAAAGRIKDFFARPPPILKASLTTCCVLMTGDVLAQRISRKHDRQKLDWKRVARFGVVGATLHGPYFFTGMRAVDQYFGPAKTLGNAVRKMAAAQTILFPPFVALLFGWVGILEGKTLHQCAEKIKTNYPQAFKFGCVFWPVANVVNFKYVGPHQRVLFVAGAGLVWNTFISWVNARGGALPATPKKLTA